MSTLENRLILLGTVDLPAIGKVNYYHRYTIYTKDNGEQWVFRSGPSGDSIPTSSDVSADIIGATSDNLGAINFTAKLYRNADGSVPYDIPPDSIYSGNSDSGFDSRLHLRSKQVIAGTDSELDSIVSGIIDRGLEINERKLPYSLSNQNSNTADSYVTNGIFDYDNAEYEAIEGTGLSDIGLEKRNEIESNGGVISGKKIFAPATDEDFESTVNTATVAWDLIESSVDWLYKNTGNPLGQLITEAGGDVAEWTSEIADLIGATSVDLFNSANDFFSNLFGLNDNNVTAYDDKEILQLTNSGTIATNTNYVDENGNPVSLSDAFFKVQDSSGNSFTIIKKDVYIGLKDGTIATLESVIEMAQTAKEVTVKFVEGYIIKEVNNLFLTKKLNYN